MLWEETAVVASPKGNGLCLALQNLSQLMCGIEAIQKLPPMLWKTAEGACAVSFEAGVLSVGVILFPAWQVPVNLPNESPE